MHCVYTMCLFVNTVFKTVTNIVFTKRSMDTESWLKRKKSRNEKDIRKIDRTHDIYPKSRLPSDNCLPGG